MLLRTLTVGTMSLALVLVGEPVGARAQGGKTATQSPRIVAFGDDEPEAAATAPEAKPETEAPAPKSPVRDVAYGAVVPPAPRVVASNGGRGGPLRRPEGFAALPAAASRLAVNSPYGVRHDPLTGAARMHTGVDLGASYGETVGASMSGTVRFAGRRGGYGNLVVVDHGHGISTYYAHLAAIAVSAGTEVAAGQFLGYVGSTGRSTGPHLHYEVRANGHPLDPATAIAFDGKRLFVHGREIASVESDDAPALPSAPGSDGGVT
jgi:murein DD-endopeptidase MepM/ murein hydrolase activator NlpD